MKDQMDFSKNKISSATANKHFEIPFIFSPDIHGRHDIKETSAEGADENNQHSNGGTDAKLQKSKKPTNNFMSPTFSTALKANVLRKNMLMERNGTYGSIFSDTHVAKSPKMGAEDACGDFVSGGAFDRSSQIVSLPSKFVESGDSPDSSSLPYDPLTNYLSPRPQFLRYKPNRRLEIFHRMESKLRKDGERLGFDESHSFNRCKPGEEDLTVATSLSLQEKSEKQEDRSDASAEKMVSQLLSDQEINENDDGEDEDVDVEEEEDRSSCCRWTLTSLLLLSVLIFVSFYISSTEPPTISPFLQAPPGIGKYYLHNEHHPFRNLEVSKLYLENFKNFIGVSGLDLSSMGNASSLKRQLGERGPSDIPICNNGDEETGNDLLDLDDFTQRLDLDEKESHKPAGLMGAEEDNNRVMEMDKSLLIDDMNSKYQKIVAGGENEEARLSSDVMKQEELKAVMEESGAVFDEGTREKDALEYATMKFDQMCEISEVQDAQVAEISEPLRVPEIQFEFEPFVSQNIESDAISGYRTVLNSIKKECSWLETMQAKLIPKDAVEFSLLVAMAVSMLLGFLCLQYRRTCIKNKSSAFQQASSESIAEENGMPFLEEEQIIEGKCRLVFPEKEKLISKGDSYVIPSSIRSNDNHEFYSTHLPMVELLGEYRVGEISCSGRSSDLKSSKIGREEINFSQSQGKNRSSRSKKHLSYGSDTCPSISEFSTTGSPSYGSFTTIEKLIRKEEGCDQEEVKVVMTPVRRSSRIRNRAISP